MNKKSNHFAFVRIKKEQSLFGVGRCRDGQISKVASEASEDSEASEVRNDIRRKAERKTFSANGAAEALYRFLWPKSVNQCGRDREKE